MISDLFHSIKLLFRKDKELYCRIRGITGFLPHNIALYQEALTAKSMMVRNAQGHPVNNERLEFLGDAILGAVVADIVYKHFPTKPEGFLTSIRSKVVERSMLGQLANVMGITAFLHTSQPSSSHNSYIGGNAFEALVGALYLDRGYAACMRFVERDIFSSFIDLNNIVSQRSNFKSQLLEWAQKRHIEVVFTPLPTAHSQGGEPIFEYTITIGGVVCGQGKGFSKKEAQQYAAEATMKKIRGDKAFAAALLQRSNSASNDVSESEKAHSSPPSDG